MLELYNLIAQGAAADGGGITSIFKNNNAIMMVFMVGFLVFFYFVVIRPQNKKKKEMEIMLKNIKKGDKIISIGGIHGKVMTVKDDEIVVKIDDNATITFDKSAVSRVVDKQLENKKNKNNNDDNK